MENREAAGLDGPPRAHPAQGGGLGTGTLDLALQILEFLAYQSEPLLALGHRKEF
jgi:hypothetical protein